jgi:hypothetical protein
MATRIRFEREIADLQTAQFMLVLSRKGYDERKNDCKFKKGDPPIKYWDCEMKGVTLPKNSDVQKVSERHCEIPTKYIQALL